MFPTAPASKRQRLPRWGMNRSLNDLTLSYHTSRPRRTAQHGTSHPESGLAEMIHLQARRLLGVRGATENRPPLLALQARPQQRVLSPKPFFTRDPKPKSKLCSCFLRQSHACGVTTCCSCFLFPASSPAHRPLLVRYNHAPAAAPSFSRSLVKDLARRMRPRETAT